MSETLTEQPQTRLRRWDKREPIRHEWLNQPVDFINQHLGIKPPEQVFAVERSDSIRHQQFQVVSVGTDYLVCSRHNGTSAEAGSVKVALPYLLRKTPFDGKTRNSIAYTYSSVTQRTAGGSEAQLITPSYVADDIIYAISGVTGGTGVTDENSEPVTWLDLNLDGRAWAKESS